MSKPEASEVVTVSVRLPRKAFPEGLASPVPHSRTAVSLLRGRWTCRQADLVMRVEGPVDEIRGTLRVWESRGFKVNESGRDGNREPSRRPGIPLFPGRLSP